MPQSERPRLVGEISREQERTALADVCVENSNVGNDLPYERLQQIRKLLLHFSWKTERVSLVRRLAEINVYGDIDPVMQTGSFYDYDHQGWITARVIAADRFNPGMGKL